MGSHPSNARHLLIGAMVCSSLFSLAMVLARPVVVGQLGHQYLVWNLFLAWIPFVVALAFYDRVKRGQRGASVFALGASWLVFLPNAPYIVTDLIHLPERAQAPIWFDVLLYVSFAWSGLLLGLVSLYLVHTAVGAVLGAVVGWAVVVGTTMLSAFGIYLGRFLRWNSWDILASPVALLADILAPLRSPADHAAAMAVTVLFTGFTLAAYLVVYALAGLRERSVSSGRAP